MDNATGCNSVAEVLASFSPQALTAPAISSTDYEDGRIILAVSVSNNGGAEITSYNATCTDGTNTYTGTSASSPITVSGLTNDVAYRYGDCYELSGDKPPLCGDGSNYSRGINR